MENLVRPVTDYALSTESYLQMYGISNDAFQVRRVSDTKNPTSHGHPKLQNLRNSILPI
jgi:hypothetical protein